MRPDQADANGSASERQSRTTRRGALSALGVAATTVLAGCSVNDDDRETTTVEYSVPGRDVDSVAVSGDDGETTVRGWEGDDVRVEATKYAVGGTDLSDVTVTREVTDGRLEVGTELQDGVKLGSFGGGFEEVTVRVPRDTPVARVELDDGVGQVADVSGDLTLDVDDGDVEVGPVDGGVDLTVDDGTVTVGDVDALTGELDDGSLEMTEAATVGDVTVDDGDLELAVGDVDGEATVECDDGRLTARIAPTVDATVVARSDGNAVQVEGGLFDSVTTDGETTRGRIGDGSDRLNLDVDDGDIRLGPL